MPSKAVVVNSSPLITLFNSQLIGLLPQLFGRIQVPPPVWREVTAYKTDIAAQSLPESAWAIRLVGWALAFGKASRLLGITQLEFQALLASRDLYIPYDIANLYEDIKTLQELRLM